MGGACKAIERSAASEGTVPGGSRRRSRGPCRRRGRERRSIGCSTRGTSSQFAAGWSRSSRCAPNFREKRTVGCHRGGEIPPRGASGKSDLTPLDSNVNPRRSLRIHPGMSSGASYLSPSRMLWQRKRGYVGQKEAVDSCRRAGWGEFQSGVGEFSAPERGQVAPRAEF